MSKKKKRIALFDFKQQFHGKRIQLGSSKETKDWNIMNVLILQ